MISAIIAGRRGSVSGATDEPVYDSGNPDTTLVMQDGFDSYTSATDMGASPGGALPKIVPTNSPYASNLPVDEAQTDLVTGRGGIGKAGRLRYYAPTNQTGSVWQARPVTAPPAFITNYFQFYARVNAPTGWGGPGNGADIKWCFGFHRTGNTRVQWNSHPPPLEPNADILYQFFDLQNATGGVTANQASQPIAPYPLNRDGAAGGLWENEYKRYTQAYRPHSAPGADDGWAGMWVANEGDPPGTGTRIINVSAAAIGVTPPGGWTPSCTREDVDAIASDGDSIRYFGIGGVQTTFTPDWEMVVDDILWWRSNS